MVGDLWFSRNHGGPGFRGWVRRQVGDLISLVRPGRHVPANHTALEVEGGFLVEACAPRVRLVEGGRWAMNPYLTVWVYRPALENYWNDEQKAAIARVGVTFVGRRYSYFTLLGHAFCRKWAAWIARRDGEAVICAECTAAIIREATGMVFRQRHTDKLLAPEEARPRDLFWTVAHDDGRERPPFKSVFHSSHGKVVHGSA